MCSGWQNFMVCLCQLTNSHRSNATLSLFTKMREMDVLCKFLLSKKTKHQQHDKKNQQHRAKISDSMEWVSILIAFNFLVNLLSFFEFVNTTNIIFRSTWLIQWIYNKFKCWMRMEISWKSRKTRTKYVKSFYERKKNIHVCVYAPCFYNLLPSREQLKVLVANNHRCI